MVTVYFKLNEFCHFYVGNTHGTSPHPNLSPYCLQQGEEKWCKASFLNISYVIVSFFEGNGNYLVYTCLKKSIFWAALLQRNRSGLTWQGRLESVSLELAIPLLSMRTVFQIRGRKGWFIWDWSKVSGLGRNKFVICLVKEMITSIPGVHALEIISMNHF